MHAICVNTYLAAIKYILLLVHLAGIIWRNGMKCCITDNYFIFFHRPLSVLL